MEIIYARHTNAFITFVPYFGVTLEAAVFKIFFKRSLVRSGCCFRVWSKGRLLECSSVDITSVLIKSDVIRFNCTKTAYL